MSEQRPRILVVGPTPPPYTGMSVALDNLMSSPLRERFELILLDIADRRGLSNVGRFDWQNVVLALRDGISFVWLLVAKWPDIVYVCISQNTLGYLRDCLFLIPARLARRDVVVHLHGSHFRRFYEQAPAWLKLLVRWSLVKVSRAIVLGAGLRNVFQGLIPEERIATVPNGIDPSAFETAGDSPSESRSLRIAYLGALDKRKGYIDLLHAAALVVRECPSIRFHFAGGPCSHTFWEEAESSIEEQDLGQRVVFEGVLAGPDKVRFLKQSSVFAFPSWNEGLPYVVLEAMAAGLPVVATDVGCIPDAVLDGVNGFIVPVRDPEAIAEKLLLLIKDRDLRDRMGKASESRLRRTFTIERWTMRMQEVFNQALEQRHR